MNLTRYTCWPQSLMWMSKGYYGTSTGYVYLTKRNSR